MATKNDQIGGGAIIVGALSVVGCGATFGLGCGLQVSLLIHAGVFVIADPFPDLDHPVRFDNNFGQSPLINAVDTTAEIYLPEFSKQGREVTTHMFHELAVLIQRTREVGSALNRALTASRMNSDVEAVRQLALFNHAIPVVDNLQGSVAATMREVATYLEAGSPFELAKLNKANARKMLNKWQAQDYGSDGLPPEEKRLVDAYHLSEAEQFSVFNIQDAGNAYSFIPDDLEWTIPDILYYYAALLDGNTKGVSRAFVGQGRLLEVAPTQSSMSSDASPTTPIRIEPISEAELAGGRIPLPPIPAGH